MLHRWNSRSSKSDILETYTVVTSRQRNANRHCGWGQLCEPLLEIRLSGIRLSLDGPFARARWESGSPGGPSTLFGVPPFIRRGSLARARAIDAFRWRSIHSAVDRSGQKDAHYGAVFPRFARAPASQLGYRLRTLREVGLGAGFQLSVRGSSGTMESVLEEPT